MTLLIKLEFSLKIENHQFYSLLNTCHRVQFQLHKMVKHTQKHPSLGKGGGGGRVGFNTKRWLKKIDFAVNVYDISKIEWFKRVNSTGTLTCRKLMVSSIKQYELIPPVNTSFKSRWYKKCFRVRNKYGKILYSLM